MKTFPVDVDGVGHFEIFQRTPDISRRQAAEFNRLSDGQDEMSQDFRIKCACLAELRTRIAQAPHDWKLDDLDIFFDEEDQGRALTVFAAVLQAEETFRQGAKSDSPPAGE